MHIEELITKIQPLSKEIIRAAQKRFDNLIKPVGSLAQLESMTARYAGIIGSSDKQLVTVPETRLLLLWGEAKHAAQIEAAMLQKKALSVRPTICWKKAPCWQENISARKKRG